MPSSAERGDSLVRIRRRRDGLTSHAHDDVAGRSPASSAGEPGRHGADQRAFLSVRDLQLIARVRRQRRKAQAELSGGTGAPRVWRGRSSRPAAHPPARRHRILTLAQNVKLRFLARHHGRDRQSQIARQSRSFCPFTPLDHIARFQPGPRHGGAALHAGQQRARSFQANAALSPSLPSGSIALPHAHIASGDVTERRQLVRHGADHVRRDGEADADRPSGGRKDRRVHADDLAVLGEQRAAGVALIDRRVDLDELVIGTRADVAADRRHDPGRHRSPDPNGLPIATTHSPGRTSRELPSWMNGSGLPASTLNNAMSVRVSLPSTLAFNSVPSSSVTTTECRP